MESLPLVLSIFLMGLLSLAASPVSVEVSLDEFPLAPPLASAARANFPAERLVRSLSASGVVILDLQSGQELFARNATKRRPVASLTKIMTAVVIAESHAMDEVVTIPKNIKNTDGNTVRLLPGAHFTVGDLLSALLIASANDAAESLARFHSGSSPAFVTEMNERARMLGLRNTSFANPTGLDDANQSTPRDIAWLAAFALRNPEIRKRLSSAAASIRSREGVRIALTHTHALLGKDEAVVAGKTGTTVAAGECLLTLVKEGSREYLVVLLGSGERYVDLRTVLRVLSNLFA